MCHPDIDIVIVTQCNTREAISMSAQYIDEILGEKLAAFPYIKLGMLFGSLGRGDERGDSDLDLAVSGSCPLNANQKIEVIEGLAILTGRPVDLIDLQAAGDVILNQVFTTGRMIHCTDRYLYAELMKRMLFSQADFLPYHRRILAERRKAWIDS